MLTVRQAVQTGPWQLPIRIRAEAAQQEVGGHAVLEESNVMVERRLEQAPQPHRGRPAKAAVWVEDRPDGGSRFVVEIAKASR